MMMMMMTKIRMHLLQIVYVINMKVYFTILPASI